MSPELAPLLKLSREKRLQLAEELWDSIADEQSATPVPDWKVEELRRRKANLAQNPESARTWEEVKQRIQANDD